MTPSSMPWWKAAPLRVFKLFVDDAGLALAIVVWLALVWGLLPYLPVAAIWHGVILFLGLAIILLGSLLGRFRRA